MSTTPPTSALPRSADQINADIRALIQAAGGVMTRDQARAYQELVSEWDEAVHLKQRDAT